ncbi:hypothetical protein Poli38472_006565 [Pythium oligandrum]|uniref:Phosphodiesterase n=1 Tax=Pythium oligandrum TaxID=41045 RepID=A0A8K1C555_PYTOL|nr:hypothetical protein Poli38472_006565 [Pythium oligandrum]|eukprot:TMW56555.1 hypothetical protein Poli38472_006565 [Pythium oligandrum]
MDGMGTDRTVYVPLGALNELVRGARTQSEDERRLSEQLAAQLERVELLKAKTADVEKKLAQYKTDHRQSLLMQRASSSKSNIAAFFAEAPGASVSVSVSGPSVGFGAPSSRNLTREPSFTNSTTQGARTMVARERVTQLEEVMASVKEISAQGEFEDVISRTLAAAQKLVRADKYTLGLLNERRNIVELYSVGARSQKPLTKVKPLSQSGRTLSTLGMIASPPKVTPQQPLQYESEGFIAADSATTYARVIMTAKALHIEDFYTHENYDNQAKSDDTNPQALLCLPICNAQGAVVGILQVVSTASRTISPFEGGGEAKAASNNNPPRAVFTENDRKSLEFLSVVAGAAIWNLILFRERQTAQSRIEGLLKLHRNISMETVSSVVLDQVLSVCHELIGTERIGLFLKVDGEDELYIACAADIVRGDYVPITKGIVGYVARTGETVVTNDAYNHRMFDPTLDHKTGFITKRILCLPVKSPDGAILAVVSAVNKIDNTDFSGEDAVFLNYAAEAVGISLHKASLLHEVKTSQKLIEGRLHLTTFIAESTDIEKFVDLVMEIGKEIMECDRFGLLLIDHFKQELWITPRVGGESIRTPMNRGISGLVATTGQVVCTRDAYKHELFDPSVDQKTGYRTTSVLCMPIFEDHVTTSPKVVAVAMCINKHEGSHVVSFNRTDRIVMEKYCREVQFALGRLSLDISYYKVVYDCISGNDPSGELSVFSGAHTEGISETDIISSIVQKYYPNNTPDGGEVVPSSKTSMETPPSRALSTSLASVVPALLKKKQEDDAIPFPREITFPNTEMAEILDRWDTNTVAMTTADINVYCSVIFRAYGFLEAFRISSEKFAAFTSNVANYYRNNSFHNYQHAFQVVIALHVMIRSECRKFFSGIEIFAMFVAAFCHDIDHPGNTNDFELKTLSPMALTHNDDAVLERHHCRVTFIILNHKSAKILQHLDETRYKRVRQMIISCILATDMSRHFEKCKALENLTRRQLTEKRSLLMGILMHAADISYQALPFKQAYEWGSRLLDEFQNQSRTEADQGIPTDFFMQNLDDQKTRLIVQLNLINYVARPIWLPLTSLCHHLRFYADELDRNFEMYQQKLNEYRLAEPQSGTSTHDTTAPSV